MIQQNRIVRGTILLGLSLLGLALVWLFLSGVSTVQATPPIEGNPVSMGSASTVATTSNPARAVAAADLDQNGRPDLAFGEGNSLRIVANTGTSSPSWSAPTTVGSTSYNVVDLVAVDIDRDSKTDLVTAASEVSGNSELKLWRNPGNPFATPWASSNTPTSTANIALTTVAAGDLNGDGAPDLVTGGHDGIIRLWRNPITSTQSFTTTWDPPAQIIMAGAAINRVALADFDRDGRLDVAVVCGGASRVVRLWRNPGAPFTSAWTESNTLGTLSDDVLSVAVADFDDDARPDMAVGDAGGNVLVWRNPLIGTLPFATSWGSSVNVGSASDEVRALTAANLDNDGYPDLVAGSGGTPSELLAWHNDGTPFNGSWQVITVGTPSDSMYCLTVADFERDGDVDVASGNDGAVFLWPNTLIHRDAVFDDTGVAVGQDHQVKTMLIGDLNRDGRPDIVAGQGGGYMSAWENDGTPFNGTWPWDQLGWSGNTVPHALADLDGDGDLDIVAARWCCNPLEDGNIEVWRNDGDPFAPSWWTTHPTITMPGFVSAMAVGDLDGNGAVEIVAGIEGNDSVSSTIEIWRFEGDPFVATSWISAEVAVVSYTVHSIALGDLNNNGRLDIVFGTDHAPSADPMPDVYQLRAARNDGAPFDGGWTLFDLGRDPQWTGGEPVRGYRGATIWSVDVADFDNDGYLDIVTGEASPGDHQIMVWKNDGTPFDGEQWQPTTAGFGPYWEPHGNPWLADSVFSVVSADLNNDGLVDLVSGSGEDEPYEVIWWENSGIPFGTVVTDTHWIRHDAGAVGMHVYSVGVADFDSDGDMDFASQVSDFSAVNGVDVWQNKGGIVGQVVSDTAPAEALGGTTHDLMRVVVSHHGKTDDHDIELAEWRLTFEGETSTPLSSAQVSALISNVVIYRDANDNSVWQLEDTPVVTASNLSLTSGVQTFSFTPGDPLAAILATETVTYFVVATLKPNANQQTPSAFQVTFDPDAASVVKDRTNAASVSVNDTEPVTAGPVQAIAGPAAAVNVEANPTSIPADGTSTSEVTATVEDAYGNSMVDGTVVTFTTTLGSFPTAPYTTTTLSGVATATLTSITTVGTAVVTATAGIASGQTTVTFTAGSAADVSVEANPASIPADGTSTSEVTATVEDDHENPVLDGTVVTFTTTLGSFPTAPYTTTTLSGVATATLTSSTTAGTAVVTTTANSQIATTTVTFTVGNLHHIAVSPATAVLAPTATQLFTATGYDQYDNEVSGLTFTWDVVNGGGTIDSSGMFTAGTTPGTYTDTVQATAETITDTASVTIEAGAADMNLTFLPLILKGQ